MSDQKPLCPFPLRGLDGEPCGRPIDHERGLGMCEWHSDEALGIGHIDEEAPLKPIRQGRKPCVVCGKREIQYRVTKRCGHCQKQLTRILKRQKFALKDHAVVQGFIVEP